MTLDEWAIYRDRNVLTIVADLLLLTPPGDVNPRWSGFSGSGRRSEPSEPPGEFLKAKLL